MQYSTEDWILHCNFNAQKAKAKKLSTSPLLTRDPIIFWNGLRENQKKNPATTRLCDLREDLLFLQYNTTMVDLLERLEILLEQEVSGYRTEDYLASEFQRNISLQAESAHGDLPLSSTLSCSSSAGSSGTINEVWRERICKWSYQVVDHFDLSREVVTISIHYLDRYLSTRAVTKKMFQLVAMTTLYLAIKLYEPGSLSMKSMIDLSRGFFTVEQMAEMEMDILR